MDMHANNKKDPMGTKRKYTKEKTMERNIKQKQQITEIQANI